MRKLILVSAIILIMAASAWAILPMQTLTATSTAQSLPSAITAVTSQTYLTCWVSVAGGNVRVRLDSVAPTTTSGHLLPDQTQLKLESSDEIKGFRYIQGDAGVNVPMFVTCW